jgi:hypothetical protein
MLPPLVLDARALYEMSPKSQCSPCFFVQNSYITGHMEQTIIIDEILFALAKNQNISTKDAFHKVKNEVLAKYRISE